MTTPGAAPHLPAPLPFPPLSLFGDKKHTVSYAIAQDPSLAPKKAAAKLFPKPWFFKRLYRRFYIKYDLIHVSFPPIALPQTLADPGPSRQGRAWSQQDLDQAAERGDFPRRPSDLFLKVTGG